MSEEQKYQLSASCPSNFPWHHLRNILIAAMGEQSWWKYSFPLQSILLLQYLKRSSISKYSSPCTVFNCRRLPELKILVGCQLTIQWMMYFYKSTFTISPPLSPMHTYCHLFMFGGTTNQLPLLLHAAYCFLALYCFFLILISIILKFLLVYIVLLFNVPLYLCYTVLLSLFLFLCVDVSHFANLPHPCLLLPPFYL